MLLFLPPCLYDGKHHLCMVANASLWGKQLSSATFVSFKLLYWCWTSKNSTSAAVQTLCVSGETPPGHTVSTDSRAVFSTTLILTGAKHLVAQARWTQLYTHHSWQFLSLLLRQLAGTQARQSAAMSNEAERRTSCSDLLTYLFITPLDR